MDPPRIPCISCERLFCERDIKYIDLSEPALWKVNNESWTHLMNYCKINRTADSHICQYCLQCFKKCTLPSLCVLNNLIVTEVPDVIKCLNMYEKILIQRAKAFQVVKKKKPNEKQIT